MALFPWSKNKTPALPGPSAELPWTLTVGVDPGTCSDPTWQQVEEGLYGLNQEQDSFLILEQQDPHNPNADWFIQCAVARIGPDQGRYSVEVGFPGARGWRTVGASGVRRRTGSGLFLRRLPAQEDRLHRF